MAQFVEWAVEPTDEYGDIIDPLMYRSEKLALAAVAGLWSSFPAAATIEVARRTRFYEDEELEDQEYDYRHSFTRPLE